MIEDSRLKIFMAVAELGGFTLAAKKLGVTQPAISQNIAELEKVLGTELFVRARGSVTLTAAGETFKEYASRILYWYSATEELFGTAGKLTANKPVRVSADAAAASGIVPKLIAKTLISGSGVSFCVAGEDENDYDVRISVSKPSGTLPLHDRGIVAGTAHASAVTSSDSFPAITSLDALPSRIKFAVWKPYKELLPFDIVARIAVEADSPETVSNIVSQSPDIAGILPLASAGAGLKFLPIHLPELDFDIRLAPSSSFASSKTYSLLLSLAKTM